MILFAVYAAAALAVEVAAPSPKPIPAVNAMPEYVIGKTIMADVTTKLGKPSSTMALSNGMFIAVYMNSNAHIKAASFVPIVGLFAGGVKSHAVIRTFTFGPDGLLKSYMTSESGFNCNTNLAGATCN